LVSALIVVVGGAILYVFVVDGSAKVAEKGAAEAPPPDTLEALAERQNSGEDVAALPRVVEDVAALPAVDADVVKRENGTEPSVPT
jgi:hypothetical protein